MSIGNKALNWTISC